MRYPSKTRFLTIEKDMKQKETSQSQRWGKKLIYLKNNLRI